MKRKALRVRSEGSIPPYVTEAESRKQRSDSPLCNSLNIDGLIVEQFDTPGFMAQVYQFFDERQRKGLSFTDCTVLYQGITLSATVLTGDKKMMRSAKEMDIDVRGILYIFDQLVEQGILSHSTACQKLQQLFSRNTRLPKDEIDKRLTLWSNS